MLIYNVCANTLICFCYLEHEYALIFLQIIQQNIFQDVNRIAHTIGFVMIFMKLNKFNLNS